MSHCVYIGCLTVGLMGLYLESVGLALVPVAAVGPLMGGPHCRLSILRNGNVPCRYFRNFPVNFKIA